MTSLQDRLRAAAAAELPDAVATLERYVALETPTGSAAALDAFADVLVADAERLGAHATRVARPDGDVVVLRHPGRGGGRELPPALLVAHHDTVHPAGSLTGPVPLRVTAARMHGPGTYDMKGGIVVGLTALRLLAVAELDHRPVTVVCTPDEEVGSPSSGGTVVEVARGVAYALGLESPHPGGALKTSRRGSTRVRIAVTGRAAHAAIAPEEGVSAIDELVDQLLALRAVVAELPDVLCNVGTISGGGRTNVVADEAWADVGLRFVTGETERAVLARLQELAPLRPGAEVSVRVLSSRPAWGPSGEADRLLQQVQAAAAAVGQTVTGRAAPGAADTNLTGAAGVPSLDGLGPLGGGAHAVTEHIELASLADRAVLLAAVLHQV